MAKHRKTRKEKLVSEKRRQVPVSPQSTPGQPASPLFSIPTQEGRKSDTVVTTIGTHEYGYLSHDLLKTAILTASIVIAELVLKFVIKV